MFQLRQSLMTNNETREQLRNSIFAKTQQQTDIKSQQNAPTDNQIYRQSMGGGDILRMILQDQKSYIQSTTEELDFGKESRKPTIIKENLDDTRHDDSFIPKMAMNQEIEDDEFGFNEQLRPKTSQPVS